MRGILGNKLINGLGVIGICGWGGYALRTAALDTRVKATATVTMYDMSRVLAYGCNDSSDEEARYQMRVSYNSQGTEDIKMAHTPFWAGILRRQVKICPSSRRTTLITIRQNGAIISVR